MRTVIMEEMMFQIVEEATMIWELADTSRYMKDLTQWTTLYLHSKEE